VKSWLTNQAIALVLPILVGQLAYLGTKALKASVTAIDNASPHVKQTIVVALSFILTAGVKVFGQYLPGACVVGAADDPLGCLTALANPGALTVIVSALVAIARHEAQPAENK
jgi:hypothetical protein